MAPSADLVLRMKAQGGAHVKDEVAGVRGAVTKLDTETVRAAKRGERAMGMFARSAHGLRPAFAGAARGGVGAFTQIEHAAKRSGGRITGFISNAASGLGKLGKGGAVGIGAGIAGFFGVSAIKSAMEGVQTLAEGTQALHQIVGLSTDDATRMAAVANSAGISTRALGVSMKMLANQTTSAMSGNKTAIATFKHLGISLNDVKQTGGDMHKMFDLVADRMNKTRGGALKTAAASHLLGKGWMTLNPLLEGGGKDMRSLEKFAAKLGITLSGNTGKNLQKARDAGYRFKLVMMAVQLFIVNKLVPALLKIAAWLNAHVIPAFRWFGHAASDAIHWVSTAARQTERWVVNAFTNVVNFVSRLPGRIANVGKNLWNGLKSGLIDVINWVIGKLNWFIQTYNSVVGSIPLIGSSLTVGTIGMIGPGGTTGKKTGGSVTAAGNQIASGLGAAPPGAPPIIPGPVKHNIARAGAAAMVAPVVQVQPVPVHAHFHWNKREVAKVVTFAGTEAKSVS